MKFSQHYMSKYSNCRTKWLNTIAKWFFLTILKRSAPKICKDHPHVTLINDVHTRFVQYILPNEFCLLYLNHWTSVSLKRISLSKVSKLCILSYFLSKAPWCIKFFYVYWSPPAPTQHLLYSTTLFIMCHIRLKANFFLEKDTL